MAAARREARNGLEAPALRRALRLWRCACGAGGAIFALHTGQPGRLGGRLASSCYASQHASTPLHSRWALAALASAGGAHFAVVGGLMCLGWVVAEAGFGGFPFDSGDILLGSIFHPAQAHAGSL